MDDIERRVREVVVKALRMDIKPGECPDELGKLDSMYTVELTVQLENEFDIFLDEGEFGQEQFKNISGIVETIKAKL